MQRADIKRCFDALNGQEMADRWSGQRGDHDLNPGMQPQDNLTPAAVLVPLVDRPSGLTVLLTQRTAHLNDHAGQISFPGGRVEPDDPSHQAAALREAEEEVGLPPSHVEVIGTLDYYIVRSGYRVTPVVGFVNTPFEVKPDPFEVAEVFEVPLSFVINTDNHVMESRTDQGVERTFYVLPYENRYIWGATAGMLVNLTDVLAGR
jgi:8-oxo-dGTP pyrophosphatase MutT (NUDIX family)